MQSWGVAIGPARLNDTTCNLSSAAPLHLRLWRRLQSAQLHLVQLSQGHAGNSNFSIYAEFNNDAATGFKPNEEFASVTEIENAASRQGLSLHLETVGPFFRVRVLDLQTTEVLGVAQGAVKVWMSGRILHLDSVRLRPLSVKARKPIFGIGFLLGAAAVRYGYDQRCNTAELLAIKDTDTYHSKLVRYYSRLGFKTVYEVRGESLQDVPHMLIWGGVGTRMDASIEELLLKWSPAFKKLSK